MEKIKIELTISEARFLSKILGHVMAFLLNFRDTGIEGSQIDQLKVKIDEELLKQ